MRLILRCLVAAAVSASVVGAPGSALAKPPGGGGGASATPTPYSGEAYNVVATLLGSVTVDPFPHAVLTNSDPDGLDDVSLVKVDQSLAPLPVEVTVGILDATVYGTGNTTVAYADAVGNGKTQGAQGPLKVTITTPNGPVVVTVRVLSAEARSTCVDGTAVGSYDVSVADLGVSVPGLPAVAVADPVPDTTIPLGPLGYIAVGEHDFTGSTQTANALHIVVNGIADVVLSHASATIDCGTKPPPTCLVKDFMTGGGWIADKATFGFNGGQKSQGLHGHLTYIDHDQNVTIRGTTLTGYEVTGATERKLTYAGTINGSSTTITLTVSDNGEPGGGVDGFRINAGSYAADGPVITRGNVQLHQPAGCSSKKGRR